MKYFEHSPKDSKELYLPGSIETYSCDPKQTCPQCDGSRYCSNCGGNGKETCRKCGGQGKTWCPTCGGNGNCPKCNGDKYFRCGTCDGSGVVPNGPDSVQTCYHCHGEGKVKCNFCNGYGNCPTCDGHQKVTCSKCRGTRKQTCTSCSGSGQCATCSGNGIITCLRCQGTGNYQTYLAIRAHRYTKQWNSGSATDNDLSTAKHNGDVIFEDTYREWENAYEVGFDNGASMQKQCFDQFTPEERDQFMQRLKEMDQERRNPASLGPDSASDKPFRSDLTVVRVPCTTIHYTVDGKTYTLRIEGKPQRAVGVNNYLVLTNAMPSSVRVLETSDKQQDKLSSGSPKKRAIAMLQLGFYIAKMHGDEEWDTVLRNALAKKAGFEKGYLASYICRKYPIPKDQNELIKCIKPLLYSNKTLAFCWHCMAIEHKATKADEQLLAKIASLMPNVTVSKMNELKQVAVGINTLTEQEMLEEYIESSKDMRGIRGCFWTFFILLCAGIYLWCWGLPGWESKYAPYCNSKVKKEVEKGQYDEAYQTICAFNGSNKNGTLKSVLPLVEVLAAYPIVEDATSYEHLAMAEDLFERYKSALNDESKYQKKVLAMADTICSNYLFHRDLRKANYYLPYAGVKGQVKFGDRAIEYLCKCGKQEWAKDYIKSGVEYVYQNVNARKHGFIYIADELEEFYSYYMVKARWEEILNNTHKDSTIKPDMELLNFLRKKSNGKEYIP